MFEPLKFDCTLANSKDLDHRWEKYYRCPGIATITEHNLPVAPRGRANKPRQTIYMSQTKEKQRNQLLLLQQGDHKSRQDPLNVKS